MKHIRNSKKGVFILQNDGIPNTSFTDFDEPIQIGSLCIDSTNQQLYSYIGDNYWERVNRDSDRITSLNTTPLNNERIDVINGIFVWDSPSTLSGTVSTQLQYNNQDIVCPPSSRLIIDYKILSTPASASPNTFTDIFERVGSNDISLVDRDVWFRIPSIPLPFTISTNTSNQSLRMQKNTVTVNNQQFDVIVEYSYFIHKI